MISSSCHDRQAARSAMYEVHKVLGAVFVHDEEVSIFVFHLCDVITSWQVTHSSAWYVVKKA